MTSLHGVALGTLHVLPRHSHSTQPGFIWLLVFDMLMAGHMIPNGTWAMSHQHHGAIANTYHERD